MAKSTYEQAQQLDLYLHGKNQVDSSIFSEDIVDLRSLPSNWLKTFWLILQEPELSQVWHLSKRKANNMNCRLTLNSDKSNKSVLGKP